ncbi:MAG TPA: MotA/TolQ/ExbB proton channel family protein [Chitinivibrionales bacterium]|nr:MotA/TolQ/ExbB proton channel family protein [Chitinivibrionales bacterium]
MIHAVATFFNSGGPFMWVILIVLAISTAVVIERAYFYFVVCRVSGPALVAKLAALLRSGKSDEAKKIVEKGGAPITVLLRTAVDRFCAGMDLREVEEGIEESAIIEMPRMIQRLNYLSLFANIATLLGLLGTISGLQASFSSLAAVEASKKATMLAAGIAEAMNCTAFGLMVAVPCMVAYTWLYNKQAQLTKMIDDSVVKTLNFMKKLKQ